MQSGAPSYPVLLGRRDGFESNAASVNLPSPSISWQSALAFFKSKGLDVQDMSTLLGNKFKFRNKINISDLSEYSIYNRL